MSGITDSKGTPIPDDVAAHVQRVYGEAAEMVVGELLLTGKGFAYAVLKDDEDNDAGIVIVALDGPNTRKLRKAMRKLGGRERNVGWT